MLFSRATCLRVKDYPAEYKMLISNECFISGWFSYMCSSRSLEMKALIMVLVGNKQISSKKKKPPENVHLRSQNRNLNKPDTSPL